jgi:hypothetical protein
VRACGSTPPEPTKTAADGDTREAEKGSAKPQQLAVADTNYDLSPVPEPQDVVALFQWKSPALAAQSFSGCASLPPDSVMGALEFETRKILRMVLPPSVDPKSLAAVVSYEAPVYGIVALEPQTKRPGVFVALSLGLTSLERAKAAVDGAGPMTEVGPGMFRIGGRTDAACVIAASAGPSPARLVCGPKEKDIMALGPYVTRTLPTSPGAGSDMRLELRFLPAEARFGSVLRTQVQGLPVLAQAELAIGDPTFDKAIIDAASGVADEVVAFVADADKVTIDASIDPTSCVRASGALAMRGKSSFIANVMGERPDRAGPPPAIFWRAPKDSGSVFYGRGTDPKKYTPILRNLRLLLEGGLHKVAVGSDADIRALAELMDLPIGKDVETVSASGHVDTPAPKDKALTPQQEADALVRGWIGWSVIGYEEGSANMSKYLRKVVDVYGRKGFQDPIKKMLGPDGSGLLPKLTIGKGPAALGADSLDVSFKMEKLPARLLKIKGATEKDVVNIEAHVLLMSDGKSRTWMAIGFGKPDGLVKRLLSVKTGAPDDGTIATRTDLEPLRRGKFMGGGFMTAAPLLRGLLTSKTFADFRKDPMTERILRSITTMPNQGNAPIFLTTSVTGADAPRGEVAVSASKQVLEDIGWLMKTLGPR